MSKLKKVIELVLPPEDRTEGTSNPFWYIAVNAGGVLRRPVMISYGIWFSREAAKEHLLAKSHRYPKTAFVYCDSADMSVTGLRRLYDILRAKDEPEEVEEYRLDNYQHFLGRIAEASGVTGSPTLEEVLERVRKLRSYTEKNATEDWEGRQPEYIYEAREALGWLS